MWNAFTVAFISIFGGIAKFGSAFGKIAGAVDNLADVAEATTKVFADEAEFKRNKQVAQLQDEMKKYKATLEANNNVPAIAAPAP